MMATPRTRARVAVLCGASLAGALAVGACGTIADLDVKYDSVSASVDGGDRDGANGEGGGGGGVIIRDSSFVEPDAPAAPTLEPSDAGPCNPDTDPAGGCDLSQGLGCCLLAGGSSRCIFQWEIATACAGGVFVGCRADDPSTESACCWRNGPANSKMSVLGTSCDGGAHACDPNADGGGACADPNATCSASACALSGGGTFTFGTCGSAIGCDGAGQ